VISGIGVKNNFRKRKNVSAGVAFSAELVWSLDEKMRI
jgi:hypothetical protein